MFKAPSLIDEGAFDFVLYSTISTLNVSISTIFVTISSDFVDIMTVVHYLLLIGSFANSSISCNSVGFSKSML